MEGTLRYCNRNVKCINSHAVHEETVDGARQSQGKNGVTVFARIIVETI